MVTADESSSYGPCPSCGFPFFRHRVISAIIDRVQAGEDMHEVAEDYGWPDKMVRAVMIARCKA